jgi:hypothetical protein
VVGTPSTTQVADTAFGLVGQASNPAIVNFMQQGLGQGATEEILVGELTLRKLEFINLVSVDKVGGGRGLIL